MAYDEELAQTLRDALARLEGVAERKMFGGLCFLLNGNMLCGTYRDRGMFRVGKENAAAALALPHVAPMAMTGRCRVSSRSSAPRSRTTRCANGSSASPSTSWSRCRRSSRAPRLPSARLSG
jgi:hypothetical protein